MWLYSINYFSEDDLTVEWTFKSTSPLEENLCSCPNDEAESQPESEREINEMTPCMSTGISSYETDKMLYSKVSDTSSTSYHLWSW